MERERESERNKDMKIEAGVITEHDEGHMINTDMQRTSDA